MKYFEYKKIEALRIEDRIITALSSKEFKCLSFMIRCENVWSALGVSEGEKFITPRDSQYKRLVKAKQIISLYEKAGISADDWYIHWDYHRSDQRKINGSYKYMEPPERKDNKTYINRGNGYGYNRNRIRYPRKSRKTAWKRFYKLFPHLNPENQK